MRSSLERTARELAVDVAMAAGNPEAEKATLHAQPQQWVYLDYAATAPLGEEAAVAMAPFEVPGIANLGCNANANALYGPGRAAFDLLENARRRVARALQARRPDEIIFTSGATEADNTALRGLMAAALRKSRTSRKPIHLITTAIEHDAILAPARALAAEGVEVTYLKPNRDGFIELSSLEKALTDHTVLVSVQMANSEVGAIQPIADLAELSHSAGALFHTDAVQALGKLPINLASSGIDAASFSAHKVGGPKGVGVLYARANTPFQPFMEGGGQEAGRRSGTQNVAGAVGLAAAFEAAVAAQPDESARLRALRDELYQAVSVREGIEATVDVTARSSDYLPNIVHLTARHLESETMVLRFDELGICVSGGSACSSHSLNPSHVLAAMGISADRAYNALRVSLGRYTTSADIAAFLKALDNVLQW